MKLVAESWARSIASGDGVPPSLNVRSAAGIGMLSREALVEASTRDR